MISFKNTLYKVCPGAALVIGMCTLVSAQTLLQNADEKPELRFCKNPELNLQADRLVQEYLTLDRRLVVPDKLVRVFFHILRNDDGTNAGATMEDLESEFADLLEDFAPGNICFAYVGVDFIDNTLVNNSLNPDIAAHIAWLNPFLVPDCINVFYHANLVGYGGNAYAIPNTFCSVDKSNIGLWRTTSHEVGHCLGLSHTHNSGGHINGDSCALTGDRVCDTPADPYDAGGCFANMDCSYTGSCADPSGATNYSPPYSNIMSYWGAEGCTLDLLTTGQYTRAVAFLETNNGLQGTWSESASGYGPATVSSGFVFKSRIGSLSTTGTVRLLNTVQAGLGGTYVTINPGFVADPTTGTILIRSTKCQ